MMDIKGILFQWFLIFFYKRASSVFLCAIHILSKYTRVFPLKE